MAYNLSLIQTEASSAMFHLIVSFAGWPDGGGTIDSGRIYIEPGKEPDSRFFVNGKLDIGKVGRIPALVMSETTGREPRIARVAHITGIQQGQRKTSIQYVIDTTIAPMRSEGFEDYASHMGMAGSLATTHWEVCSGDLYKVLFFIQQKKAEAAKPPAATVFSINGIFSQNGDLVSVMMPFGAQYNDVYKTLKTAASDLGLECKRADDIWEHHHVIQDIVDLITKARVVVCDCSGRNPNVFYEIGIAHSLGKDFILSLANSYIRLLLAAEIVHGNVAANRTDQVKRAAVPACQISQGACAH